MILELPARRLLITPAQLADRLHLTTRAQIPQPRKCLAELRRVLRPDGLLSITEHLPDPDFSRFPRLRALVEPEGFEHVERFGPPWSYTANFRVRATGRRRARRKG